MFSAGGRLPIAVETSQSKMEVLQHVGSTPTSGTNRCMSRRPSECISLTDMRVRVPGLLSSYRTPAAAQTGHWR
jgi:hypothetical protein